MRGPTAGYWWCRPHNEPCSPYPKPDNTVNLLEIYSRMVFSTSAVISEAIGGQLTIKRVSQLFIFVVDHFGAVRSDERAFIIRNDVDFDDVTVVLK